MPRLAVIHPVHLTCPQLSANFSLIFPFSFPVFLTNPTTNRLELHTLRLAGSDVHQLVQQHAALGEEHASQHEELAALCEEHASQNEQHRQLHTSDTTPLDGSIIRQFIFSALVIVVIRVHRVHDPECCYPHECYRNVERECRLGWYRIRDCNYTRRRNEHSLRIWILIALCS